jgi:hypothetical protein
MGTVEVLSFYLSLLLSMSILAVGTVIVHTGAWTARGPPPSPPIDPD